MNNHVVISHVTNFHAFTALQAHFFKKSPLATFNCKMVATKKIQSPKRNLKARTLHDILHERLMRRTARFQYFALL